MAEKKKEVKDVISVINDYQPKAFYTIEDVRFVLDEGIVTAERKPLLRFPKNK